MTNLVIRREKNVWQDRLRSYRVIVDGREVGQVANDAVLTARVEPGAHLVQLQIDWCHSNRLEISIAPGETKTLECGPNAKPWTGLLYVTILRYKYLWLRSAEQPSNPSLKRTSPVKSAAAA